MKPPLFHIGSQHVHGFREMHVRAVCRSMQSTLLRDGELHFTIPNLEYQLFTQNDEEWRHDVRGLALGCDQNALIGSISINLQNALLYYHQIFHSLLLQSNWNWIAMYYKVMPTKGLCLNLKTAGSCVLKVRRMTVMTPSKAYVIHFLYHTVSGLYKIGFSILRSTCQKEKLHCTF